MSILGLEKAPVLGTKSGQMTDEQKARFKRARDYAVERHGKWTERAELLALHLYLFAEKEGKQ